MREWDLPYVPGRQRRQRRIAYQVAQQMQNFSSCIPGHSWHLNVSWVAIAGVDVNGRSLVRVWGSEAVSSSSNDWQLKEAGSQEQEATEAFRR